MATKILKIDDPGWLNIHGKPCDPPRNFTILEGEYDYSYAMNDYFQSTLHNLC